MITSFNEVVNSDINSSVYLLEKLLHYVGSCMFVRSKVTKVKNQPPWWSTECETLKKIKYKALNILRKSPTDVNVLNYNECRRRKSMSYCNTCKFKHENLRRQKLLLTHLVMTFGNQ